MRRFEDIDKTELRDLLVRNWMTHDAMWFANTAPQVGMAGTNAINRAAVRAMAAIEAKRLAKLLEVERITCFAELRDFLRQTFEIIRGPFMQFDVTFPEDGLMRWTVAKCFAYEGVSRLGIADQYECGIFERLDAWLDALGVAYSASPAVLGCLIPTLGACAREYRFTF